MGDNISLIMQKVWGIDTKNTPEENVDSLKGQWSSEKEIKLKVYEKGKEVSIYYDLAENLERAINIAVAAGLPINIFEKAEKEYRREFKKYGVDYKYILEGSTSAGSLAQYSGIVCWDFVNNYQVVTYNGLGINNFIKFRGHEFFGINLGLLFFLKDIMYKNRSTHQSSFMSRLEHTFVDRGILRYDKNGEYANISSVFRRNFGSKLKSDYLKKEVIEVARIVLNLDRVEAESLVNKNFNLAIVERKMRFIDNYYAHKNRADDSSAHYIYSEYIPARLIKHIGEIYIVDQCLSKEDRINKEILKCVDNVDNEQLEKYTIHNSDLFKPFFITRELGNGSRAKNRNGKQPEIGQITDSLSMDYLKSLIKDIIINLKKKDSKILIELFKCDRFKSQNSILEVIKDRLRHSMLLQNKVEVNERLFKSQYFNENKELFTEDDKVYSLDKAALDQLDKRMSNQEITQLYKWELTGDGIYLVLCEKTDNKGDKESGDSVDGSNGNTGNEQDASGNQSNGDIVIEYHSSDPARKFDNKEEKLKLECAKPSKNRIYGSLKQIRYIKSRDIEYIKEKIDDGNSNQSSGSQNTDSQADTYYFANTQGVGFEIFSEYTSAERKIKIDGTDISGDFQEKD
ncbi:MAG: hypothetical protein ACOC2J_04965, partial [bacterium]